MPTRLKKPLATTHIFRLRLDLDHSAPAIWRRLDVRSDANLGQLHSAIQAAFGWEDYHLHQFAVGGKVFGRNSRPIVSAADAGNPDLMDWGSEFENAPVDVETRIDQTLHKPGDKLYYVYDYGDNWDLTIKLEAVLDADPESGADAAPVARCTGGKRWAPPEDCGGRRMAVDLQAMLDDPDMQDWLPYDPATIDLAVFDIDAVNARLDRLVNNPLASHTVAGAGLGPEAEALLERFPRFKELVVRIGNGEAVAGLLARLQSVAAGPESQAVAAPTSEETVQALATVAWFLERVGDKGIKLTAAGYLPPAFVKEANAAVPMGEHWIGSLNREADAFQVFEFRAELQRAGLLRKQHGRLLLTKAGTTGLKNPDKLFKQIASRLQPDTADLFTNMAGALALLAAATGTGTCQEDLDYAAEMMTRAGWVSNTPWDRVPYRDIDRQDIANQEPSPVNLLWYLDAPGEGRRWPDSFSAGARAMARAALLS